MILNTEKVKRINEVVKDVQNQDALMKAQEPNETYLSSDTEKENIRQNTFQN
jgi:hypothetical protein